MLSRLLVLTSCWQLAVNLRVHFFVSNVASYFFNCLSHDGNSQDKTLESEMSKLKKYFSPKKRTTNLLYIWECCSNYVYDEHFLQKRTKTHWTQIRCEKTQLIDHDNIINNNREQSFVNIPKGPSRCRVHLSVARW